MQNNIYLIGYMYCGKTTLGKKLAQRLGYSFVDLDQLFEEKYKTTIPIFFQKYGEDIFRKFESKILQSTANLSKTIIATGGGTPCQPENMKFILQHGKSIYLQLSTDAICSRMVNSKKVRPLLAALTLPEKREFIQQQLLKREPFYNQATLTIDAFNPNPNDIIEIIMQKLPELTPAQSI